MNKYSQTMIFLWQFTFICIRAASVLCTICLGMSSKFLKLFCNPEGSEYYKNSKNSFEHQRASYNKKNSYKIERNLLFRSHDESGFFYATATNRRHKFLNQFVHITYVSIVGLTISISDKGTIGIR
jgi:hypothetical protein